jgi:homoserine/homoserine lactone efflux protein
MAYKAFTADPPNPQVKGEIKNSRVFAFAVMVSLSNPKVILVNIMLRPLFLVPEKSLVLQGTVMAVTGMALSFIVYSAYALIASKLMRKLTTTTANRVVGFIYTGAGVALASINK